MLMVGVRLVNPLEEMTSFSLLLETPQKMVWLSTLLPAQVSDVGSPEGGAPHRLYYNSSAVFGFALFLLLREVRHFASDEKNDRGVVKPEQEHHQGAQGAI